MLLDPLHKLNAVAIRQVHVGQAELGRVGFEQAFGRGNVFCGQGVNAHAAEGDFKQVSDVGFVVDNQGCVSGHWREVGSVSWSGFSASGVRRIRSFAHDGQT